MGTIQSAEGQDRTKRQTGKVNSLPFSLSLFLELGHLPSALKHQNSRVSRLLTLEFVPAAPPTFSGLQPGTERLGLSHATSFPVLQLVDGLS